MMKALLILVLLYMLYIFMAIDNYARAEVWSATIDIPVQVSHAFDTLRAYAEEAKTYNSTLRP